MSLKNASILIIDDDTDVLTAVRLLLKTETKEVVTEKNPENIRHLLAKQSFDAILLDAPCTASGIVRRHPDVRWLRRPTDSAQLAKIQAQLLHALWPLLAFGGRLLYCTCSVFKAEGDDVVQTFVRRNTDALLQASPGHLIPGQPPAGLPVDHNPLGEHDGFYYALLEKRQG